MHTIELTTENLLSFRSFIPADMTDHIGRAFHHGLITIGDDEPLAGMLWEMKNMMNTKAKESRILWLRVEDEKAAPELFEKYTENIALDDVVRSFYSIPAVTDSLEKTVLSAEGFDVKLSESDEITAPLWQIADMDLLANIREDANVKSLLSASPDELAFTLKAFDSLGFHGLCEDLIYLPRMYFENEVSCFYRQDRKISGLLLFHRMPSGSLKVMLMAANGKDSRMYLLKMIKRALNTATDLYSPDTRIIVDRHNYSTLALVEKLFPDEIGIPVYIGSRKEG